LSSILIGEYVVILQDPAPICTICGKPIPLETSNTDSNGAAVHENCYAAKIAERNRDTEPSE
jgi:hypothetical protein